MNVATGEPWLKTIMKPNKPKTIKIGNSQYFFLSLKNSKNSLKKLIIKIVSSLNQIFYLFLSSKYFLN